jgi:predicted ATPase/tRNA A-37 threonylcarbamoyl transferase component Bud32
MSDFSGKQFGPYEILGVLGTGGMAEIYRARDTRLGRQVALKLLSDRLTQDADAVSRFITESHAASALNHPNIVTIYEAGEIEGHHCIVMELVEGRTLRALLTDRQLPLGALPDIAGQIARALAAAHAAGIVHRDIKPENVMVRDDGYVKVVDFGIARLLPTVEATSTVSVTGSGIFVGTPRYMSPEQVRGESLTSASDIFSFGVVLYEWAAERHPFAGDSTIEMLQAITAASPLPASMFNAEIPVAFDAMLLEMLQKDPARRPRAVEVVELMQRGLAHGPHARGVGRRVERTRVGRQRERKELLAAVDHVATGGGLLVSVSGEPGMGKTTIVESVLRELEADGHTPWFIARGRCSERLAGAEAYLPLLEALHSLLEGDGRESVARVLKTLAPAWHLQLDVASNATAADLQDMKAGSQERLKRQLLSVVEELSRLRPVVLFIDDLHWADAPTVDLIAYIAAHFDRLRLLVIATYRGTELALAAHPFRGVSRELQGRNLSREIALEFLTRDDIAEYLALEFPNHRFPDDLPGLVHEKTEGNPLFMVDLVRDLRDRGLIAADGDAWVLAQPVLHVARTLPASIRSLIQRKLDSLEEDDRRLLTAASVQGVQFDAAIVAQALGADPIALEDRFDVLDRVHALLRVVGEAPLPDGTPSSQYRFVHALYQDGLYTSLRPARRAALSGAIARALAAAHARDTTAIASQLGFLFEAAGDRSSAARHFLAAAQKAADVFAYAEGIALARRGLEMLQSLPETPDRVQLELEMQLALGQAMTATKGYVAPEVEQAYTRARALCPHAGGQTTSLFRALQGLWRFYGVKPDLLAASELADELLALARGTGDNQLVAVAHLCFGGPLVHRACFADALQHMDEALSLYDPDQYRNHIALTGADLGVRCLIWSSLALWLLGYPDRARVRLDRALTRAQGLPHPFTQASAFCFAGWAHQYRREPAAVERYAAAALAVATEHGLGQWVPVAIMLRGWAIAEQGRARDGIDDLRRGLDVMKRSGAELNRPHFLSMLAEAYLRDMRPKEGLDVLDEACAIAEANHDRCWMPELVRLKGVMTLAASNSLDAAEASFREAIELARRQEAKLLELRAASSLTRLHAPGGQSGDASSIAPIYSWFSEGFDTSDLREAHALLSGTATSG